MVAGRERWQEVVIVVVVGAINGTRSAEVAEAGINGSSKSVGEVESEEQGNV